MNVVEEIKENEILIKQKLAEQIIINRIPKDLVFEKLYEKTQNCGRVQFVKILQHQQLVINRLSRKIQKLKRENLKIRNNSFCKEVIQGHEEDIILLPNEIKKEITEEITKNIMEFEKDIINGISNREVKGLYDSIK